MSARNSGEIQAFLAASHGASVVAIESDEEVSSALFFGSSKAERRPVLPLVVDFARPFARGRLAVAPNRRAFIPSERPVRSTFVMMLAVLHHLMVSERIPLEEVFEVAKPIDQGAGC